jgi:hypothetical protein
MTSFRTDDAASAVAFAFLDAGELHQPMLAHA